MFETFFCQFGQQSTLQDMNEHCLAWISILLLYVRQRFLWMSWALVHHYMSIQSSSSFILTAENLFFNQLTHLSFLWRFLVFMSWIFCIFSTYIHNTNFFKYLFAIQFFFLVSYPLNFLRFWLVLFLVITLPIFPVSFSIVMIYLILLQLPILCFHHSINL